MKVKHTVLIISIIAVTHLLTSCGTNNTQNTDTEKVGNYSVVYNAKEVYSDVNKLLSTGDISELNSFDSTFEFDSNDMYTDETETRVYFGESVYYMQVGTYMYRFQFNTDGKIESYIKYNLEG